MSELGVFWTAIVVAAPLVLICSLVVGSGALAIIGAVLGVLAIARVWPRIVP